VFKAANSRNCDYYIIESIVKNSELGKLCYRPAKLSLVACYAFNVYIHIYTMQFSWECHCPAHTF